MIGKYDIEVVTRKVDYQLTVERNITILSGNSATGKSTLYRAIKQFENDGRASGIKLTCDRPCVILEGKNWENDLKEIKQSIVFVDEGAKFINTEEFATAIKKSDNYYVLITRQDLGNLPYSIHEIYELDTNRIGNRMFCKQQQIYKSNNIAQNAIISKIVTEDSKTGYEFYNEYAKTHNIQCEHADGKTNVSKKIVNKNNSQTTLIIVDGAAYGSEMNNTMILINSIPGYILFTPESFEWLLLNSNILNEPYITEVLKAPYNYIESSEFFSWEKYFTDLLNKATKESNIMPYNKSNNKSLKIFTTGNNMKRVIE
uniref:translation initiation factor 2 n=1 Tax=Lachnospira sp. TaxID=2049031 RepID=UPI00402A5857